MIDAGLEEHPRTGRRPVLVILRSVKPPLWQRIAVESATTLGGSHAIYLNLYHELHPTE